MKNNRGLLQTAFITLFALGLSAGSAKAVTTTFDFTTAASAETSLGGALSFTQGGLTVTATAYNTGASGTALSSGYAEAYNGYGLGICSSAEGTGCSSPQHQIDNSGRYEFMLFRFTTPVNLSSVQLRNFGTDAGSVDMDISYWFSVNTASTITLSDIATPGNGFGTQSNVSYGGAGSVTSNVTVAGNSTPQAVDTLVGSNVTYLLIGAAYAAGNDSTADFFKISGLTVTTAAPEPATFGLFAFALAGFGVAQWRKRKLASARIS